MFWFEDDYGELTFDLEIFNEKIVVWNIAEISSENIGWENSETCEKFRQYDLTVRNVFLSFRAEENYNGCN